LLDATSGVALSENDTQSFSCGRVPLRQSQFLLFSFQSIKIYKTIISQFKLNAKLYCLPRLTDFMMKTHKKREIIY